MKLVLFFPSLWLASAVAVFVSQPVLAQVIQVTQVTDIRLEVTDKGLDLILTTADGTSPKFSQTQLENGLIIEIFNAQLRLPGGTMDFQKDNPLPGITSIQAIQDSSNIQIIIVSTEAKPVAQVTTSSPGLIISVNKPDNAIEKPVPETTDDDEIVIIATQESTENSYIPPKTSSVSRDDTPILDTPQDIDVVPGQVIRDQGSFTVGETFKNIGGVTTGRAPADSLALVPVIRGFESQNILRNGLRDETQRFTGGITTNVERVEVLKGPASILFGQGNLGGTVNIVTKQPVAEPLYDVEFNVGDFELYRPVVDIGGPLNPEGTVLYRIASSYQTSGSFIDFQEVDRRVITSPSIAWNISERTQILFEAEYLDEKTSSGAPELPAVGTVNINRNGDLNIRTNLGEPSLTESESYVSRFGYRFNHEFSDKWSIKNEFLAAFKRTPEETGNLFILPVALQADQRTLIRLLADNPSDQDSYTFNTSVIGNFNSGKSVTHKLFFGVEYAYEQNEDKIIFSDINPIDIFDVNYSPNTVRNRRTFQDFNTDVNSWGLYLQNQITFFEKFILVVGGRQDFTDQNFSDRLLEQKVEKHDSVLSPRVGLIYKPIEAVSLYASYSRSFEPVIGQAFNGEVFDAERGTQYEIGVKAELFQNKLLATLSLYNLRRTNYLEQDPDNPGFQIQIGGQRSRGVDFDATGEILPGWNIITTYSYTDAIITEDERTELIDNQLQNVPEHSASLWTVYFLQQGTLQGLGFGVGVFFENDREGDVTNTFIMPGYVRADAAIYYRRGQLQLGLNFKNIFGKEYFEGARNNVRVIPGAPFSVLGTLSWEF